MIGAKLALQVSDPVTLWVRGDVSGFGLAGDTDLSWNVIAGADWWVSGNISLQLGYRFYEINYKNGSGNNAYGLTTDGVCAIVCCEIPNKLRLTRGCSVV